jgi:hypothetical protein
MSQDSTPFATEMKQVENFKKALLLCAGAAVQKLMTKLDKEQEILMYLADIAIDTFQAECVLLRTMKMHQNQHEMAPIALAITKTFITDAADRIHHASKNAINSFAEGDEQRMMLMGVKRFTKTDNYNTKTARRQIADMLLEKGHYWF